MTQTAPSYDDERARALLSQVAAQRQDAFETLYAMLSKRVFAFVRRSVDNVAMAEEIMMDTMFEVWKSANLYRGDARVSTWVLGIARNKMLMTLRSQPSHGYDDIEAFAEIIASDTPDGLAALESKRRDALLKDCMERLPPIHRECLHLLHFEDCSVAEIAALQAVPPGTVKSRLSHARARLQTCVEIGTGHIQLETA